VIDPRIALIAALFLFALPTCPAKADSSSVMRLSNTTEEIVDSEGEGGGVSLTKAIFDASSNGSLGQPFAVVLVGLSQQDGYQVWLTKNSAGTSLSSLDHERDSTGSYVAIAGGFLGSYAPTITPVGFTKTEGMVRVAAIDPEADPILSGVVCFDDSEILIKEAPARDGFQSALQEYSDCLQAGPVFVANGQPHIDHQTAAKNDVLQRFVSNRYTRGFFAIGMDGKRYFGLSTPVSLSHLAAALTEGGDGIEIERAIHLHGSTNAGLVLMETGSLKFSAGSTSAAQATIIVVGF